MRRVLTLLLLMTFTACSNPSNADVVAPTLNPLPTVPIIASTPTDISSVPAISPTAAADGDLFTQNGIELSAPTCDGVLTPEQTEGPYYKPDTPEQNSLFEEGMEGTRLILVGYVVDQNCQPIPRAGLDFWQADANGNYDNQGYRLRGHQFTDDQGRYYLETVIPGPYPGRPIPHIHVKVRPPNGDEMTSQLYFPSQPVDRLTAVLEDRGDYAVGYFNFIIKTP